MRAGAGDGAFLPYAWHALLFVALFIAVCYYATHGWMRLAQWIEHRHPTARIITFPARSADVIELYPNERGSA